MVNLTSWYSYKTTINTLQR